MLDFVEEICICREDLSRDADIGIRIHTHECWLNLLKLAWEAAA